MEMVKYGHQQGTNAQLGEDTREEREIDPKDLGCNIS